MPPLKFDWSIKFGDILTSLTILVSVAALLVSWSKDRTASETEQADLVRSAAARALTQIDRWQLLNLALYQQLQPVFVETSESLSQDFNVIRARDHLWKEIDARRTAISQKILDEEILTSYVSLLSHFPEARKQSISLFQQLNAIEEKTSSSFLEASQQDVLKLEERRDGYTSAMLGNALRTTAQTFKEKFRQETVIVITPAKEFLLDVIAKSNSDILGISRNR